MKRRVKPMAMGLLLALSIVLTAGSAATSDPKGDNPPPPPAMSSGIGWCPRC